MTIRTLRDIVAQQTPVTAPAAMSVRDAAIVMRQRRIGAMMVVEGGVLVGVFTERDALNRVVAEGRDPQATALGDVMTKSPRTLFALLNFGTTLLPSTAVATASLVGLVDVFEETVPSDANSR